MLSKKEQINQIISGFDWEKVHKTMKALKWTWALCEQEDNIPSIGELVVFATKLLEKCEEFIACGGFVARNIEGYLSLEFVITEWSAMETN